MPGFYHVNLPAFRAPGPLNFSGLNQGIDAVGKKLEKNRLLEQDKAIGSAIQADGYGGGADAAFAQGNLSVGGQLAGLESADEDRDFNRNRLLAQDRRAAASDARSREIHGLNVQKTKGDIRDRLVKNVAGVAQMIRNEQDPSRKAQMVQALINANPRMGQELSNLGLDPANPDTAMDMIIAEARGLPKTGDAKFGTSPQYYRDPQTGEVKVGQLSSSGGFRPAEIPGEVLPGLQFQNLGTEVVGMDRRTGQRVTSQPIDVAGKAAQTEVGKAQGEAEAGKPAIVARGTQMISAIDALLNDPYLPKMTGPIQGRQPNIGGSASRVQSRMDQLQGQLFLQAYQDLKGGGAISDFEAGKAEQALGRIGDPTLSDEDYKAALTELRSVINAGVQRAQSGSTGQSGQQPATRLRYNPATGELE